MSPFKEKYEVNNSTSCDKIMMWAATDKVESHHFGCEEW